MAEQITIPISIFDLTVWYQKVSVRMLADRADLVQTIFDAFSEFNPNADDIEVLTTGKTSEQGIRLRIPLQGMTFFVGPANCKFIKEAAIWADADKIIAHVEKFLKILSEKSDVILGRKATILTLHLQPKTASFKQILLPFVVDGLRNLDHAPLDAMAVVARWRGRRITLDGSAQLANGIYAQMEREFPAETTFDQIKQELYNDELNLFKLLDVQEVEA